MKSTMKLMVAALVVVALLAVPAMARTAAAPNQLNIGDVAFVYETNLDVDTNFNGNCGGAGLCVAVAKFGNDCPDPTGALGCTWSGELSRITLNTANRLDINAVPAYFGTWFPVPASGFSAALDGFQIQRADVTVDAVLNNSHTDSIASKSVTRDNKISFKLITNYAGNYFKDDAVPINYLARVNIELTTPGGGKIQIFGANQTDLRNINLTGSVMYTDSLPPGARYFPAGTGPMTVSEAIDLSGVEAGTYTATAKWSSTMPWYNQESNSAPITFTVLSKPITITTNKESVVRGNSFVVTITGESKAYYFVYVKSASLTTGKNPPYMAPGQAFVNQTLDDARTSPFSVSSNLTWLNANMNDVQVSDANGNTEANVTTAADGTRAIQFNTNTATDDRKFTIKVLNGADLSKYDQVDVSVEKGQITITYEGAGTYYLGETVKITGTNTDNETVYLAIKGPNLNEGGQSLQDIFFRTDGETCWGATPTCARQDNVRFKMVDVNTDNTWSYKWDTAKLNQSGTVSLDAGTYTLYAVSDPVKSLQSADLSDHIYQTASVVLKKPFVTASTNTNTLAKGDILYVRGTAEGKPTNVYIWTFGKNYRSLYNSASVNSDATFEYKLDRGDTGDLYAGQYFVVVQHPMMNGIADIVATADGTGATGNPSTTWTGGEPTVILAGLQASDAATALVDLLNSPNVDDTYTKLSFMIEEPWIRIDTIGDKYVGDTFKITGTTNLAEGDTILVTVTSSSFQPTEKTQTGEFSGTSGSVTVQKGDTYNTWSFDVDASTFKPDEYLVSAESIEPSQSTTTTFNVLEGQPTTVPTTERTPIITIPETPIRTTEAPTTVVPATTAKPQPGFGALVALVGLGAVALLVLRRH